MLTCEEAEPELSAYLDGELTLQERATVEAHLVLCTNCNSILNEIEADRKAMVGLPRFAAPAALNARIKAAIRADALTVAAESKTPSSHKLRTVAQIYELAEFGEPVPVEFHPARRTLPWTAMASALAAIVMVSLMGYVALAPSPDQLAQLSQKLGDAAKGETRTHFTESSPAAMKASEENRPVVTAPKQAPLEREMAKSAERDAVTNRTGKPALENQNGFAASAPEPKKSESAAGMLADRAFTPAESGEKPAGKIAGMDAAPQKSAAKKTAAKELSSTVDGAPANAVAAATPAPLPVTVRKPEGRDAAAYGGTPPLADKSRAGNMSAAVPQVISIRARDTAQTKMRIMEIAKKHRAIIGPVARTGSPWWSYELTAPVSSRAELIKELTALQSATPAERKSIDMTGYGMEKSGDEKSKNAAPAQAAPPSVVEPTFSVTIELTAE